MRQPEEVQVSRFAFGNPYESDVIAKCYIALRYNMLTNFLNFVITFTHGWVIPELDITHGRGREELRFLTSYVGGTPDFMIL